MRKGKRNSKHILDVQLYCVHSRDSTYAIKHYVDQYAACTIATYLASECTLLSCVCVCVCV